MMKSMINSKYDEESSLKTVLPPVARDEKRGCSGVSYLKLLSVKVAGKLLYQLVKKKKLATFSAQKISLSLQD